jgi:hypothetical protein
MRDIVRRALAWKASASGAVATGGDILRWVLHWPSGIGEAGAAYTLTAAVGSFTLTGRAATLTVGQPGDDVFVTPLERTLIVNADVRVYAVPYENRTILVNQEI